MTYRQLTYRLIIVALLAAGPSSAYASIIILGNGTLTKGLGPDTDGLDGKPYSFQYTIPDGTTWTPIGGGFGFGAQVSSPTIILNGTPVVFNTGELPLFATNQANGSTDWAGLVDATSNSALAFSVFGDLVVGTGGSFFSVPATISAGDPVLSSQIAPNSNSWLSQIQGLNGTFYNPASTSFSITGSTTALVPEPTTLALLGLGLAGIGFSRRKAA